MKYSIPLDIIEFNGGCHLACAALVGDKLARFLIDTGASRSVIDENIIEEFNLHQDMIENEILASGLGTNEMKNFLTCIPHFQINNFILKNLNIIAIDLSHVNQSFKLIEKEPVQGVIGGDILKHFDAIIDYKKSTLNLNKRANRYFMNFNTV